MQENNLQLVGCQHKSCLMHFVKIVVGIHYVRKLVPWKFYWVDAWSAQFLLLGYTISHQHIIRSIVADIKKGMTAYCLYVDSYRGALILEPLVKSLNGDFSCSLLTNNPQFTYAIVLFQNDSCVLAYMLPAEINGEFLMGCTVGGVVWRAEIGNWQPNVQNV